MALGATLKVKMDSSAVTRGLAGLKSKVGRAFGAIKKVGLAAFGAIAAAAAGLTAAAVSATNFVRSVEMVAIQTGMTTKEVLDLQYAFSRVSVDADGAADVMSEFQKRLAEARLGQGEAIIGLDKLNISLSSLAGLSTMEAFERILSAVTDEALDTGDALMAMDKMFGSKGFELRRLAMDYKNLMASARRETEGLGALFGDTSKFQSFERSMAKFSLLAREIQMRLVNALPLERIEEALDKVDLKKFFDRFEEEFVEFMKAPEAKLIEWGVVLGSAIGEGIIKGVLEFVTSKEGIQTVLEEFTMAGRMHKLGVGSAEGWRDRAMETVRAQEAAGEEIKIPGLFGPPKEEQEEKDKSKMRFNPNAWEDFKGMFGIGNKNQPGTGKTSSINKDILQEAKRSNVILKNIEDGAPTYA